MVTTNIRNKEHMSKWIISNTLLKVNKIVLVKVQTLTKKYSFSYFLIFYIYRRKI